MLGSTTGAVIQYNNWMGNDSDLQGSASTPASTCSSTTHTAAPPGQAPTTSRTPPALTDAGLRQSAAPAPLPSNDPPSARRRARPSRSRGGLLVPALAHDLDLPRPDRAPTSPARLGDQVRARAGRGARGSVIVGWIATRTPPGASVAAISSPPAVQEVDDDDHVERARRRWRVVRSTATTSTVTSAAGGTGRSEREPTSETSSSVTARPRRSSQIRDARRRRQRSSARQARGKPIGDVSTRNRAGAGAGASRRPLPPPWRVPALALAALRRRAAPAASAPAQDRARSRRPRREYGDADQRAVAPPSRRRSGPRRSPAAPRTAARASSLGGAAPLPLLDQLVGARW